MAMIATLGGLNERTPWMQSFGGNNDIHIGAGLTGTVQLQQYIKEDKNLVPVYDKDGVVQEWALTGGGIDAVYEGGGTSLISLAVTLYTSGSSTAWTGFKHGDGAIEDTGNPQ